MAWPAYSFVLSIPIIHYDPFQHVQNGRDSERYQTTAGSGLRLCDFRFRPTVAQAIAVKVLFED
jgi:hypothetical protein